MAFGGGGGVGTLGAGGGMWLICNFHQESPAPPLGCNPWGNGALQEHMTIF